MKHSIHNFVNGFDLEITLRIVGHLFFMMKSQLSAQLGHHLIRELILVISNYGLRNPKHGYDVIKKKDGDNFTILCICRNFLNPSIM